MTRALYKELIGSNAAYDVACLVHETSDPRRTFHTFASGSERIPQIPLVEG